MIGDLVLEPFELLFQFLDLALVHVDHPIGFLEFALRLVLQIIPRVAGTWYTSIPSKRSCDLSSAFTFPTFIATFLAVGFLSCRRRRSWWGRLSRYGARISVG